MEQTPDTYGLWTPLPLSPKSEKVEGLDAPSIAIVSARKVVDTVYDSES